MDAWADDPLFVDLGVTLKIALNAQAIAEHAQDVALHCRRAGKPLAWNVLRQRARGELAIFMDADVTFTPHAFGLLLGALAAHPEAAIASGKTTCAPRRGLFEAIMAAPYAVDFPNLSPQLLK